MKKLTQLITESLSEQTWSEVMGQNELDIDFINCQEKESVYFLRGINRKLEGTKINSRNSVYEYDDFILVCKNDQPLALMTVYGMHGWDSFKNLIILYGHEQIVIYDTDDFTHKIIYTR